MAIKDHYVITGDGFVVDVSGEDVPVGAIVGAVIDATLGADDTLTVSRGLSRSV